jgi:hypothetical protein
MQKRSVSNAPLSPGSASQAELGYETPVTLHVFTTQIVEESPTLSNHEQQTTTAVVVVLMVAKMLCQMVDPLREQGHLDFRRACVALMSPELFNDFRSRSHCA